MYAGKGTAGNWETFKCEMERVEGHHVPVKGQLGSSESLADNRWYWNRVKRAKRGHEISKAEKVKSCKGIRISGESWTPSHLPVEPTLQPLCNKAIVPFALRTTYCRLPLADACTWGSL